MKLPIVVINIRPRLTKATDIAPSRVVQRVTIEYQHDKNPDALREITELMGGEAIIDIVPLQGKLKLQADGK